MESAMTAGSGPSGASLLPVCNSHGILYIGGGAVGTSRPVPHAAPVGVTALRGEGAAESVVSGAADRRCFGMVQMPGESPDG